MLPMRKLMITLFCSAICLSTFERVHAQQTGVFSGNIKNSQTKENLAAISVTIKGTGTGTFTDEKGNFRLITAQNPPFIIVISSIGYTTKEVNVETAGQTLNIEIDAGYVLGQ